MEIKKSESKKDFFLLLFKIILVLISSFFIYLSLRTHLIISKNLIYIGTFAFIQIIFLFWISSKHIIFNTISIIIILNFLLTPIFFEITFDTPTRYPNSKSVIFWNSDHSKGYLNEKHVLTTNEKGHRVNKLIDYENKASDTLRILAIGASTTEEEGLGDNYIWSNNLINQIEENNYKNFKNYEMINLGLNGLRSIHHYLTLKRNLNLKPNIVIFLLGVNDWNNHILHSEFNYFLPNIEINYNFQLSILNKISSKIFRILKKPFKENEVSMDTSVKEYNSKNPYLNLILNQYKIKQSIDKSIESNINNVSEEYKIWLNKIVQVCKKNNIQCIFVDQPSIYDPSNLKNDKLLIWMNPPFVDYKIGFKDMIRIKNVYNNFLEGYSLQNNIKFCKLSDKIKPLRENFIDDVHFTQRGSIEVANNLHDCIKN